jgi:hypothetical protein
MGEGFQKKKKKTRLSRSCIVCHHHSPATKLEAAKHKQNNAPKEEMQNSPACRTANSKDRRDFDQCKQNFISLREWARKKKGHIKTDQETLHDILQADETKEDMKVWEKRLPVWF